MESKSFNTEATRKDYRGFFNKYVTSKLIDASKCL